MKAICYISIFFVLAISCGSATNKDIDQQKLSITIKENIIMKKYYRDDEIIVKFKNANSIERIQNIINIYDLEVIKIISPPSLYLIRIKSSSTVMNMIEQLKTVDEVEYSEPNYIQILE